MFGVDEAGKGPVLGSMFAAAVVVPDPAALPDGMADSKDLSAERREALAAAIRETEAVRVGLAEITPARIDDPETDMNGLTVAAHAEAIDDAGVDGATGVVDAGDTDADRFGRRVAAATDGAVEITAEHGADGTHDVVGAASIVAKVERDAQMTRLGERHGAVGSGYPSDPTTREFLRAYVRERGELPPFARATWATSEDVLAATAQSSLEEF